MALTDPVTTLAYHQSRVLTAHRDMSHVPLGQVANAVAEFLATDKQKTTVPEREALWFYGLNHAVALIRARRAPLEPLNEWELKLVSEYHEQLGPKAVRAFYYLLLICTRESRHNKSLAKDLPKIEKRFGPAVATFLKLVNGGEAGIHKALLSTPPETPLGNYVECLQWQFYNSKWNGGYGGPAWGRVTDCLVSFVKGEFTAEMMLDTVWTLSHNNGPIFNKGICYGMYEAQNLLRILDVQRSGQVPEAILHDKTVGSYSDGKLTAWMIELSKYAPEIGPYVDWYKVEALGAVGSYLGDKATQKSLYGLTPEAKAAQEKAKLEAELKAKAAAEKAAAAKAAFEAKKAEFEANHFTVMPGVHVKKFQRAA